VIGNFVSTVGIVSYEIKGRAGGSTISGADPADRFIMGTRRSLMTHPVSRNLRIRLPAT
jgi:hypothetical protein